MNLNFESELCNKWTSERNKSISNVENIPMHILTAGWDRRAKTYTGETYKKIRKKIIANLIDEGIISKNKTLIDIGCGPGLYAIPMSEHLKHIQCMDVSDVMLRQVNLKCIENSINNVSTVLKDWSDFVPRKKYDISFTSLCAPLNCPESLIKMEECAKKYCVYISSVNTGSTLNMEIWNELGKEYSKEGNDVKYPFGFLKEEGRSPELKFFEETSITVQSYDDAIDTELEFIKMFKKPDKEIIDAVHKIVAKYDCDGSIITKKNMKMGLLTWAPL